MRLGRAEHEIDILMLWPGVGLAAIEVKGGRCLYRTASGTNRMQRGKHKVRSPLAQSQNAQHAFAKWLPARIRTAPRRPAGSYLAASPYTDVPDSWDMTSIPRGLILDRSDVANAAAEKIRTAIEREGQGGSRLAASFLKRIPPKDIKSGPATPEAGR